MSGSVAADAFVRVLRSKELIAVLVLLGVVLRAAQYIANRSVWLDESFLALNLIEKSVEALAKPLDFNQAAPVGFLFAESGLASILGYSEYALRLLPLLCGIASLPAFAWLARRVLEPAAAAFAVLLFVVSDGLIYYASEIKPYEVDVAVTVGLLVISIVLAERGAGLTPQKALLLGLAGLALIPWSFAATFVITAVVTTFIVRLLLDWKNQLRSSTTIAISLWGFAAVAIISFGLSRSHSIRESIGAASGRFLGVADSSSPFHALDVLGTRIAEGLGLSLQQPFSQLLKVALLLVVIGTMALARRRPVHASLLILPFALLLGASALHAYPIAKRTVLFLIPPVLLLLAEGTGEVVRWVPARAKAVVAVLLVVPIAAGPVALAAKGLVQPRTHEEIRPVLEFVRDHWRAGDSLYVHYGAQYGLLYYEECECVDRMPRDFRDLWPLKPIPRDGSDFPAAAIPLTEDVVIGRHFGVKDPHYVTDLDRIKGRNRVWFLYSHLSYDGEESFIRRRLLGRLRSWGDRVAGIDRPGAHAYLYRMQRSR